VLTLLTILEWLASVSLEDALQAGTESGAEAGPKVSIGMTRCGCCSTGG
jgi:hypothetical protein